MKNIFNFFIVFGCLLLYVSAGSAQGLSVRVIDSLTGNLLSGASVYINNSSVGTQTNEAGIFSFKRTPAPPFEIMVSYVGYNTTRLLVLKEAQEMLVLRMSPKNIRLHELVVTAFEDKRLKHWQNLFKIALLGELEAGQQCVIRNLKQVKYIYSPAKSNLFAFCDTPLIIDNWFLGYRLNYILDRFEYKVPLHELHYRGSAFFIEMKGSREREATWKANRNQVYEGSLMNFLRCVFQNSLDSSRFLVRHMTHVKNFEKLRVDSLLNFQTHRPISADSMKYYRKINAQKKWLDQVFPLKLGFNEIAQRLDSNTVDLDFRDYLYIVDSLKTEDRIFFNSKYSLSNNGSSTSIIHFENNNPFVIKGSNGYFQSMDLVNLTLFGYWSWTEKVSTLLPMNYEPKK